MLLSVPIEINVFVMEVEEWPVPPAIDLFIYTRALHTESSLRGLIVYTEVLLEMDQFG